MAAIRLTLLCMLVFCARVSAAASDIVPVIPSPHDFVEVSELFPEARKLASIGHPTSEKLIGIYYPKNVLDKITSQGLSTPAPFARAYLESVLPTTNAAKTYFKAFSENIKNENLNVTVTPNSEFTRIIDNYANAVSQFTHSNSKLQTDLIKRTILIDENEPDWFGEELSVNFKISDGTETKTIHFATTVIWLRVATQVIEISIAIPSDDMDAQYSATSTALFWLNAIFRLTPPIVHSDDNFIVLDEDQWEDVIDLRTSNTIIPGKIIVTVTNIKPPQLITFKISVLGILSKFCDKPSGKYPAPTDLLTLGPPDFPVEEISIELNKDRTSKLITWESPYKRLIVGSSKDVSAFFCRVNDPKATQNDYEQSKADLTNGTKDREMLDCNRGLFNTLPSDYSSHVDDLLVSQPAYSVRGAYKHHYLAVCRKIGISEPYLPQ